MLTSQALEKSSSGFLVGEKLTLADLGLMEALLAIADYFGAAKLADYPLIKVRLDRYSSGVLFTLEGQHKAFFILHICHHDAFD